MACGARLPELPAVNVGMTGCARLRKSEKRRLPVDLPARPDVGGRDVARLMARAACRGAVLSLETKADARMIERQRVEAYDGERAAEVFLVALDAFLPGDSGVEAAARLDARPEFCMAGQALAALDARAEFVTRGAPSQSLERSVCRAQFTGRNLRTQRGPPRSAEQEKNGEAPSHAQGQT
jgi:CheY-like chemotaxis protein